MDRQNMNQQKGNARIERAAPSSDRNLKAWYAVV